MSTVVQSDLNHRENTWKFRRVTGFIQHSHAVGSYLLADNSQAEASKPMLMPCLLETSGSTMSADL